MFALHKPVKERFSEGSEAVVLLSVVLSALPVGETKFRELPAELNFCIFIFANGDLTIYIVYIANDLY